MKVTKNNVWHVKKQEIHDGSRIKRRTERFVLAGIYIALFPCQEMGSFLEETHDE